MRIYKTIVVTFSLLAMALVWGCASSPKVARSSRWSAKQLSQGRLPKFDVPIEVNDRVVAWIDYFQGTGRNHFARYLARSGKYIPQMQDTLKKFALPQDLVYLSLIESGFSHRAYSRAKAVGLWQFMSSTGRHYGLDADAWIDERRDAEKSTVAAAKYLRDLYDRFGDWYLAIAAYNAGEGKIERAIQKTGTRNFWEILERDRSYLKAETRDYVPKFIAAAIIAKSPERFGFSNVVYETPHDVETVTVPAQTDLRVVAKCAGVDEDLVSELNAELVRGSTPRGQYTLKLPRGTAKSFEVAYANVPENERVLSVRHTVRKGESAKRIARRYGVSLSDLLAANGYNSASQIRRGATIVIPTGGGARDSSESNVASGDAKQSGKYSRYRVQKGDTLASIAQNYGVSVSNLKKWNRLSKGHLRRGQVLRIWGAEYSSQTVAKNDRSKKRPTSTHIVKRGDSWWKVAQRYGVSINDLKEWNPSLAKRDLAYGQKIKLFSDQKKSEAPTEIASTFKSGSAVAAPQVAPQVGGEAQSIASEAPKSVEQPVVAPDTFTPQSSNMTPAKKQDLNQSSVAMNSAPAINIDQFEKNTKVAQPQNNKAKSTKYKVKNGDTLWGIAKSHNVSVKDIMDWNNLGAKGHKGIKPGTTLTLLTD